MDDSIISSTIAGLVVHLRDRDLERRERAMSQIHELSTPAIPWLLAALKAEGDTSARINLGRALAELGSGAWDPLLAAAEQDIDNLDFGWSVAWAVQKFPAVCTIDDFIAALRHPNVHVRWAAALALGDFADERAVSPLIAALSEDGPVTRRSPRDLTPENYHRKVRICAAKSLRRLGPFAFPALRDALTSENPLVRAGAADALTGMDEPEACEPLLTATKDPDAAVRRHAIQSVVALLPSLAPDRHLVVRDVLMRALLETDQYTQLAAIKGLCLLGEQSVAPLTELVQDRHRDAENHLTRPYALRALECLLEKEPPIPGLGQQLFPLLIAMLDEQANSATVRSQAATALGKTRNARAVASLTAALTEPNSVLRWKAAEALEMLGDSRAVPALKEALLVARGEEFDPKDPEVLAFLVDALEQAIAVLTASTAGA